MLKGTVRGALIAGAVAGLFASGAAVAKDAKPKEAAKVIHCGGVNECKGKGACSGADNACKSQNSCKGKGFIETTAKDCKDKGGQVMAAK